MTQTDSHQLMTQGNETTKSEVSRGKTSEEDTGELELDLKKTKEMQKQLVQSNQLNHIGKLSPPGEEEKMADTDKEAIGGTEKKIRKSLRQPNETITMRGRDGKNKLTSNGTGQFSDTDTVKRYNEEKNVTIDVVPAGKDNKESVPKEKLSSKVKEKL